MLLALANPAAPARSAAAADMQSLAAAPLIVHHPAGLEGVAARVALRGPALLARVAGDVGLPTPPRIDVWLLPRKGPESPAALGLPSGPEWAAGLALESAPVIVLRTSGGEGPDGELLGVLAHELVHVVVAQALGGPRDAALPAWLREGVASHVAHEWRLQDDASAIRLALAGRWLDLDAIAASFPGDADAAQLAYLESFAFVEWLDARRPGGLAVLFPALARGEDLGAAFRLAYGASRPDLEREFRRSFERRFRWIPLVTSTTTLWLLVTGLVLVGWLRKRGRSGRLLAAWQLEEEAADLRGAEPGPAAEAGETGGAPGGAAPSGDEDQR